MIISKNSIIFLILEETDVQFYSNKDDVSLKNSRQNIIINLSELNLWRINQELVRRKENQRK